VLGCVGWDPSPIPVQISSHTVESIIRIICSGLGRALEMKSHEATTVISAKSLALTGLLPILWAITSNAVKPEPRYSGHVGRKCITITKSNISGTTTWTT